MADITIKKEQPIPVIAGESIERGLAIVIEDDAAWIAKDGSRIDGMAIIDALTHGVTYFIPMPELEMTLSKGEYR